MLYTIIYVAVIVVLCVTAVLCFVFFSKHDKKRSKVLKEEAKRQVDMTQDSSKLNPAINEIVKHYDEEIVEQIQPTKDLPNDGFENYQWEDTKGKQKQKESVSLNPFNVKKKDNQFDKNDDEAEFDDFDDYNDIEAKFKEYEEFLKKNLEFNESDDEAEFSLEDDEFDTPYSNVSNNHAESKQSVDEILTNLPPKARDVMVSDKISENNKISIQTSKNNANSNIDGQDI